MTDLPLHNEESEDLFDFPEVEGFSPEFIEAARMQTEAANDTNPEVAPAMDDDGADQAGEEQEEESLDLDEFEGEFTDNFADLMGDSTEEVPEEETAQEPVVAETVKSNAIDLRFVWGVLALLLVTNLMWAWTWHASGGRLRGEMDQRFQGYLTSQRNQLEEAMTALTPSEEPVELAESDSRMLIGGVPRFDASATLLEEVERDLMHSRYDTARAKAWRLIARIDALPVERRASAEASARLLIAESYEIQGTDSQENEG